MTATPEEILARFAQSQPLFTALGDERRQTIIILLLRGVCCVGGEQEQAGLVDASSLSSSASQR